MTSLVTYTNISDHKYEFNTDNVKKKSIIISRALSKT